MKINVFLTRDGGHHVPHLAVSPGHLLQVKQEAVDYAEKEGKARNARNTKHFIFFFSLKILKYLPESENSNVSEFQSEKLGEIFC